MEATKQTKPMKISEIDPKRIVLHFTPSDIQKTKKNPNKKLPYYSKIYYRLDDGSIIPLVIQTKSFKTVGFSGIPRNGTDEKGEQFYKTEKDRAKFQIPYDDEQEACIELKKFAQTVDKFVNKNREKIFEEVTEDADPNDYAYNELYKELDKKKIKKMKETGNKIYPMLKTDLEVYANKQNKDVLDYKTVLFIKDENTKKFTKVNIKSLEEAETYVPRGSEQICVLQFDRLWASQAKIGSSYLFGIKVKCVQIYVIKKGFGNSMQEQFGSFLLDDGEVGETTSEKEPAKETNTKKSNDDKPEKKTKMLSGKKETSKKSSEESDDDSDSEKATKNKGKGKKNDKKKTSEKISDISEDSESDSEKVKKIVKKKKSEESDDDSDSGDDSD
jgi:hypothetical protein